MQFSVPATMTLDTESLTTKALQPEKQDALQGNSRKSKGRSIVLFRKKRLMPDLYAVKVSSLRKNKIGESIFKKLRAKLLLETA